MLISRVSTQNTKYALVVDDDPGILEVYEMAFLDLGFVPLLSCNGRAAIEIAMAFPPAIVVLDQRMPELEGIELARELRKCVPATTPILMISAQRHIENEALASGVTTFIEKPFDVEDLISVVLSCTDNSEALTA